MDNLHFSVSTHLLLIWYVKQFQVESFVCPVNSFIFVHKHVQTAGTCFHDFPLLTFEP